MTKERRRVMLVGRFAPGALERSYLTAFESLDCEVRSFDIVMAVERHCRLNWFGRTFNSFVPVEPWIRKANRDLLVDVLEFSPNYVLAFAQLIQPGALAQIRSACNAKLIQMWPDTLLNVGHNLIACLPLFDLVASYSRSNLEQFQRLGAKRVVWLPLAGDPLMHAPVVCTESDKVQYGADVTFIGGWRPEREAILSQLDGFDLKIWGPDWGRRSRGNRGIAKNWKGRGLYESEFAKAVASSKVNLNIIDPANYPAANMRFFEIPIAGGLQISSICPEMETEFVHGEHLFYYRDANQLSNLIATLIADESLRVRVAQSGHDKALATQTYTERALRLLQQSE